MSFKKFVKQRLNIRDLSDPESLILVINKLQDAIEDSFTTLINKIQNDSTILSNVSLKTGQLNIINHTLNRKLTGWKVIRKRGYADIKDSQDQNTNPNYTLLLLTNADVIVDLEVF